MDNELMEGLKKIAFKKSKPFCYSCYKLAPTGRCEVCGSDDLMAHLDGVGVEYGHDWIVKHIIETELSPVDTEEAFEEYVEACYPEQFLQIGWLNLDIVTVLKEMDPVSWDLGKSEFLDTEESEGNYISFDNGSTYYLTSDVQELVEGEED